MVNSLSSGSSERPCRVLRTPNARTAAPAAAPLQRAVRATPPSRLWTLLEGSRRSHAATAQPPFSCTLLSSATALASSDHRLSHPVARDTLPPGSFRDAHLPAPANKTSVAPSLQSLLPHMSAIAPSLPSQLVRRLPAPHCPPPVCHCPIPSSRSPRLGHRRPASHLPHVRHCLISPACPPPLGRRGSDPTPPVHPRRGYQMVTGAAGGGGNKKKQRGRPAGAGATGEGSRWRATAGTCGGGSGRR